MWNSDDVEVRCCTCDLPIEPSDFEPFCDCFSRRGPRVRLGGLDEHGDPIEHGADPQDFDGPAIGTTPMRLVDDEQAEIHDLLMDMRGLGAPRIARIDPEGDPGVWTAVDDLRGAA